MKLELTNQVIGALLKMMDETEVSDLTKNTASLEVKQNDKTVFVCKPKMNVSKLTDDQSIKAFMVEMDNVAEFDFSLDETLSLVIATRKLAEIIEHEADKLLDTLPDDFKAYLSDKEEMARYAPTTGVIKKKSVN